MVTSFAPMLAGYGRPTTPLSGCVVEPKFDGWRAVVDTRRGLCVRSRNGHDITDKVPSLAPLTDRGLVLDGELIAGVPIRTKAARPRALDDEQAAEVAR